MEPWLESISGFHTLRLATIGRRTGLRRVTTIWFGVLEDQLYVSSGRGEASDWIKNIMKEPRVEVTIGSVTKNGIAKLILDPEIKQRLRKLYWRKYHVLMAFVEFGKTLMRISRKASIPVLIDLK